MYSRWIKGHCGRYTISLFVGAAIALLTYRNLFLSPESSAQYDSAHKTAKVKPRQQPVTLPHTTKKVTYKDFSQCPPRPTYIKQFKAHCWLDCKAEEHCSGTYKDYVSGRGKRHCFPNLHLIGVRKCGTTDVSKWFTSHRLVYNTLQDYLPQKSCPVQDIAAKMNPKPGPSQHAFNDGPGVLVELRVLHSNDTHMEVVTPLQVLGYMAIPDTKFYVQLRNPSDRAISYLFHWHKRRFILKKKSLAELTESMVHDLIAQLISNFSKCLTEEGELACVYKYAGDGKGQSRVTENLLRHSLYVVYIEEAFKFIPREQFQFRTMDEYSVDQVGTVKSLMTFFGLTFQESKSNLQERVHNVGTKKPVWNKTIDLLDRFYRPYNERLARLLNHDKWLFNRS